MTGLTITAPFAGWAAPLEEVPDPVFAGRMMGDGVAIHPVEGLLRAPCDGTVLTLHAARHAVTIRSPEGAEILIHIGLETVALGGERFRALVAEGASVKRGDPLIEFDLDAVAQKAASLVTPVLITNGEAFRIESRATAMVAAGGTLMTLQPTNAAQHVAAEGEVLTRTVTVALTHGIHARPAASIAEAARAFDAEIELVHGDRRANVRSAVAVMGLGLGFNQQVTLEARGPEASEAMAAVCDLIESGMGETAHEAKPAPIPVAAAPVEGAVAGIPASPGLAIGTAAWLKTDEIAVERDASDPAAETLALDAAIARVRARIAAMAEAGTGDQRHILEAHLAFLDDPDLFTAACRHIESGRSAGHGWREAIAAQVTILRASGDPRFAERAGDLEDLERQVQRALAGQDDSTQRFAAGTILLAEDLLPSQLIALDAHVVGVALAAGGPTSHVAILAAAKGLPMLVAAGPALAEIADGAAVVLDADAGLLHLAPSETAIGTHRERISQREERRAAAQAAAHDPCRTADGTRIELFANLGSRDDAVLAAANGAEGSGLLRTEFLFMDRPDAPGEEEQLAAYQAIADAMNGRPIIVRLLDIGGDKPASWLPMAAEKNPMLGVRGIRVGLPIRPSSRPRSARSCAFRAIAGSWSR